MAKSALETPCTNRTRVTMQHLRACLFDAYIVLGPNLVLGMSNTRLAPVVTKKPMSTNLGTARSRVDYRHGTLVP